MAWPDYQQLTARPVSFSRLAANIRLFKTVLVTALLLVLIIMYLVGTHLSLLSLLFARTFAINIQPLQHIVAQSTLLTIVDQLFTGGSLSILSPFALGIFPLLLFEINPKPTEAGQAFRYIKEWSLSSILFFAGLALVLLWLVVVGVIPNAPVTILLTALYLLIGSVLLIVIDQQLTHHKGPDIIAINAILIAYNYARTLLQHRQLIDLSIVALIALFVWSFVWLITHPKSVKLTNIRNEIVREGELPVPRSNGFMRLMLLIITFIVLVVVTALLNVFVNNSLSPFGNSLPDVLLFIIILTMIALAFMSNENIDALLSHFNSAATAHTLMLSYWLVSDDDGKNMPYINDVEKRTARFLRQEALKVHRWNYAFYLAWAILFSLVGLFAQLLHLPLTPLPFGPLGFLILLTLCSEICYAMFVAVSRFVQNVRFGELWTPPTSTLSDLQSFLESDNLDDSIQDLLQHVPPELQSKLREIRLSFKEGHPRFADFRELFQIWNQLRKEKQRQQSEIAIVDILLTLGKYLLFALVASVVVALLIQAAISILFHHLDNATSIGIIGGAIAGIITTAVFSLQAFFFDASTQAFFSTLVHHPRQLSFVRKKLDATDNETETMAYQHNLLYDALFQKQNKVIQEERNALQNGSHAAILEMICNVPKSVDNDTAIAYYESLCTRFEAWLQACKTAIAPQEALSYPYASFPLTLTSRDALERDVALHYINTLWSQYITQQLARRDSLSSRLAVEEQDYQQFEQEIDADFEQMQRNIRGNTVDVLLTIMQRCLTLIPAVRPAPSVLPMSPISPALPPLSDTPQPVQQYGTNTDEQLSAEQASPANQIETAEESNK